MSIVGAAWGEAIAADPPLAADIHERLLTMIRSGAVRPPIGQVVPFADAPEAFRLLDDQDFAALEAAGMKVVSLEGEAKANYLAAAREKTWERMKTVMADQPGGTANYDRLIELFYDLNAAK